MDPKQLEALQRQLGGTGGLPPGLPKGLSGLPGGGGLPGLPGLPGAGLPGLPKKK